MARKKSFRSSVNKIFAVISLVTFAAIFCIGAYSVNQSIQNKTQSIKNEIDKYAATFFREVQSRADFNLDYITNDAQIHILSLPNCPDSAKPPLLYHINQLLLRGSSSYCANILYDLQENVFYSANIPFLESSTEYSVPLFLQQIRASAVNIQDKCDNQWSVFSFQNMDYLILHNRQNRLVLFTVFSIQDFLTFYSFPAQAAEDIFLLLYNDTILDSTLMGNYSPDQREQLLQIVEERRSKFSDGYFIYTTEPQFKEIDLRFCLMIRSIELFRELFPLFLVCFLLTGLCVIVFLYAQNLMDRILYFPIKEISAIYDQTEQDEYARDIGEELPEEYEKIRQSLYDLIDKVRSAQQKQQVLLMENDRAKLQYYQLQTRSHFFINCLKSLYSMLELNRTEQMKTMILAFSNHLRYIFQENLSFISLQMEIDEVNDYYQILLLDNTRPILLNLEIEDDLEDVLVPPLVIQSFLENSNKYNTATNSILFFSVKASRVWENDREYLQIRISDTGNGYSRELLDSLNAPLTGTYDTYNVGINNLKRRINILFQGEGRTAFFNQLSGGACAVISFPLIRKIPGEREVPQ